MLLWPCFSPSSSRSQQLIPEHQSLLAPTPTLHEGMEFFSGVKHVAQGSEHFKDFIPDALPDTLPYIMLGTSTGSTLACDPNSLGLLPVSHWVYLYATESMGDVVCVEYWSYTGPWKHWWRNPYKDIIPKLLLNVDSDSFIHEFYIFLRFPILKHNRRF